MGCGCGLENVAEGTVTELNPYIQNVLCVLTRRYVLSLSRGSCVCVVGVEKFKYQSEHCGSLYVFQYCSEFSKKRVLLNY